MSDLTLNLPQFAYTAQQVKQYEGVVAAEQGVAMYRLMQDAATAVFDLLMLKYGDCDRVQIIAGGGNNGGDGFWVAHHALNAGLEVSVLAVKDPKLLKGDALSAYQDYIAAGGKIVDSLDASADVLVDALLGIGFSDELSPEYQNIIEKVNARCLPIISVDLPSGLNATSGAVSQNCIKADYTVTFIALKQGLLTGNAKHYVGELWFAGLGISSEFNETVTAAAKLIEPKQLSLPARHTNTYKQKLGHVVLVGGDKTMPGAIRLAAEACLRAGAGLVSVITHPDNREIVLQGRYELMVHGIEHSEQVTDVLQKEDVCVVGPGLGMSKWSEMIWQQVAKVNLPLVLDADGLNYFAQSSFSTANLVITPHTGEASRLLNVSSQEIELNRFLSVSELSKKYNSVAILKGAGTLVCHQNEVAINTSGSQSMASAGMGDCLSGIISAFIAQGMSCFNAAQLAVFIHGRAAQLAEEDGKRGLLASDLFPFIRKLVD